MDANQEMTPEALLAAAAALVRAVDAGGAPEPIIAALTEAFTRWLPAAPAAAQRRARQAIEAALAAHPDPGDAEAGAFHGMVRLTGRLTSVEAHMVHDALAAQGLAVRLAHDHLAAADLPNPQTGVEVWVDVGDRAAAVAALATLTAGAGAPQVCGGCGEESPANFTSCWACGDELPQAARA